MNRRKFLGVLGIGTAATPLAAKAAFEEQTMGLLGDTSKTLAAGTFVSDGAVAISQSDERTTRLKMMDHVRLFGIPQHVLDQCREEAKWVYTLDFDIANKRSWSLAAKIHEQRERNYQRKLERIRRGGRIAEISRTFAKTFGFEFLTW